MWLQAFKLLLSYLYILALFGAPDFDPPALVDASDLWMQQVSVYHAKGQKDDLQSWHRVALL